jgi:DNA-binding MarR family transcriptional regulator
MTSQDTYRLINEVFLLGDDIDRQLFSRFSLTVRQYHLLNWLDIHGQASLSQLANLLLCDKSNVTGIVRRLRTAKLIEDVPTTDRRFTTVRLTDAGREVHCRAKEILNRTVEARFAGVSDEQHADVQSLLKVLHQRLRHYIDSGELAQHVTEMVGT